MSNIVDLNQFKLKKEIGDTVVSTAQSDKGIEEFKILFEEWDKYKMSEYVAKLVIDSFDDNTLLLKVMEYLLSVNDERAIKVMSAIADTKKNMKSDIKTKENNKYVAMISSVMQQAVNEPLKVVLIGTKLNIYSSEPALDYIEQNLFKIPNFPLKINALTKVKGKDGEFLLIADLATK